MKTFPTLAALALALSPTLAVAEGCHDGMRQITASSCADGTVWDETTGTCVEKPTS